MHKTVHMLLDKALHLPAMITGQRGYTAFQIEPFEWMCFKGPVSIPSSGTQVPMEGEW